MRLVMENPTKGLLTALLLWGTCGSALAGSSTGSLAIPATVAQTCSVSATSTLAFGAYDPVVANAASALTGTGSVSIKCTKGSSGITVDLDAGAHVSGTQRRLQGATVTTDFLNYGITQPATTSPWTSCACSTVSGSTVGGSVYTPSGVTWSAAAAQAFTVCGSVPAAQNISETWYYTATAVVTDYFSATGHAPQTLQTLNTSGQRRGRQQCR